MKSRNADRLNPGSAIESPLQQQPSSVDEERIRAALLLAWLSSIGVSLIVGGVFAVTNGGGFVADDADFPSMALVTLFFALVCAVFAAVAAIGIGYPLFSFIVRRGYLSLAAHVGGGVLCSLALAVPLFAIHRLGDWLLEADFRFAMLAVFLAGPSSGLAFWLAYRYLGILKRPASK